VADSRRTEVFVARERKPLQFGRVIESVHLSAAEPMLGSAVFRFVLPGVTQDEATELAREIVECFVERVKYVGAQNQHQLIRAIVVVLDQTADNHYSFGRASKRGWSPQSSVFRITDYHYELRPLRRAASTLHRARALEIATQKKKVLRFLYPDAHGVRSTRRVQVTGLAAQSFNARRFDSDGTVQLRTYSLDKATMLQVETLSAKYLSPTVVLKIEFLENWLAVSFDDPPID